ncbi:MULTISPECIES: hypothetical protein [Cellulomonas]|uniref:Uncharacterized protein n=1 Tax=Cellulomonas oligotrophica TaxID=931536 RepID=A0A7Y9FG96_9CELL|nr:MULTISPECIES: hypothetical protein [Cellulomonas]NYD86472.1 hypothetical protein [Cellulomonas oligotrophica]TQL02399.1 hypothetical protein FBY24_1474 [Cellulomonas sp. SLBN-39]GIG32637.1 hypothetical protein Col01nite_17960 [Cellulomonas oligotrophica]
MHRPPRRTRTARTTDRTTDRRPGFDPVAERDALRRDRLAAEAQLRHRPF